MGLKPNPSRILLAFSGVKPLTPLLYSFTSLIHYCCLLLSICHTHGIIAPTINPIPTLNAKTIPTGSLIDSTLRNLRETSVAFCTDRIAIAAIHAATIRDVSRLVKAFMLNSSGQWMQYSVFRLCLTASNGEFP